MVIQKSPPFATQYTTRQLLRDAEAAARFEDQFVRGEAEYFEKCRDPRSGLAYDGVNLDPQTGKLQAVRPWSAPSKECLDLGLLIKSLRGDAKAQQLVAVPRAVELLQSKLAAYREFQERYPGYAGFLPWVEIRDGSMHPSGDWLGKIPGLDNGEWMWTMLMAEKALRDAGYGQLAEQYGEYNQRLQDNVAKVFYDPEGVACRGDVRMEDPYSANTRYEALHHGAFMTGEHGVHEGCMLIHYLTLFGKGLPPGAADRIWGDIEMKRVETRWGTTWQGFWGSAHESWAYLFMPFRDHAGYRDLFRIREEIRAHNSVARGYPGFGTSTTDPDGGYLSAAGIEGIGTQPVTGNHTFAVYGVFPMLLQFAQQAGPGNYGLAWLHNMLSAPRMQGPMGAGESERNDGKSFSPVKTTDGTHPMLLAMMGGLERECADVMKEKGVYDAFLRRIDGEYREAFGRRPLREPVGFVAPQATVPREPLGDYAVGR